jgi:hypothetical protein
MIEAKITFVLRDQDGTMATYVAPCPRCNVGEIAVTVPLRPDGGFAEDPACPSLCTSCEEGLDAMLDGPQAASTKPGSRDSLRQFLKAMNLRAWD